MKSRQSKQNMSKWSPTPNFPERKSKQNHKTLHAWLLEHKLDEYHERLVAEGVTELDDFKELQERDITRMMDKWNVGILPQRVFLNKVSGLMLPSYDSAPPPLPAAKEEQPPQYQASILSLAAKGVVVLAASTSEIIVPAAVNSVPYVKNKLGKFKEQNILFIPLLV
jgi:hypothetical protein